MEKRLEDIDIRLAKIQKGYERWARRTFVILLLIVVAWIVTAIGGFYFVGQNHNRVDEIQQSRIDATLNGCRDQNFRRRQTIRRLDSLIEKAKKAAPEKEAELKRQRKSTVFLIDSLAPHRDCKLLIKQRFH